MIEKKSKQTRMMDFLFILTELPIISSIRRGLMYCIPIILVASIALLLLNMPIPQFQTFMNTLFNNHWREMLLLIHRGSFEIISIIALLSISYDFSIQTNQTKDKKIPHILVSITTLCGYIIWVADFSLEKGEIISTYHAAATGLFTAILASILISNLFMWLHDHRIFKRKLYNDYSDTILSQTLQSLEPTLLTFFLVALIKFLYIFLGLDKIINFDGIINLMTQTQGITATILFNITSHLMWFFGIHGNNVLEVLNVKIFTAASYINDGLIAQGLLPTEIFTKQFLDVFVFIGGSGTTLSLAIALMLRGKKSNTYRLARFSLIPGIFNINEILVFGLPIVLNPYFIIPFILVPIVCTISTSIGMLSGLVPLTIDSSIQWTAPVIISGIQATGSINGALMQIINVALGMLIYLPFVILYENQKMQKSAMVYQGLLDEILNYEKANHEKLIDRVDDIGSLARNLAEDFRRTLESDSSDKFILFQPKVSNTEGIMGAEALLRWRHDTYGMVPPPVVIRLAEEGGFGNELGAWIIDHVMHVASTRPTGLDSFTVSINLSAEQITDPKLYYTIKTAFARYDMDPYQIEFEIVETAALDKTAATKQTISKIKELGPKFSIDDFGMGHSSLLYIKDYDVDGVKLDGSLVRDIVTDESSQEIVASIVSLCNMLQLEIVAEFVETIEQKEKLEALGCFHYQGHLYSPAIPYDELLLYIKNNLNE